MSHKFKTKQIKLPREHDRRVKLTDEEREEIRKMYFKDKIFIREIAREFEDKCSRRLIQMVLFPERAVKVAQQYKDRGQASITYKRVRGAQWAKTMRDHRRHKEKVLKQLQNER